MSTRMGEKVGWIGGWIGGFLWVFVMAIIWLAQGKQIEGISGLFLMCCAAILIITSAPWKHPNTLYWKLMLPVYVVFAGSIAWLLWSYGGVKNLGLSWWSLFWVLPLFIPFATARHRRWNDFNA